MDFLDPTLKIHQNKNFSSIFISELRISSHHERSCFWLFVNINAIPMLIQVILNS